jgi:hypothetical protein
MSYVMQAGGVSSSQPIPSAQPIVLECLPLGMSQLSHRGCHWWWNACDAGHMPPSTSNLTAALLQKTNIEHLMYSVVLLYIICN